jgi:hypothetical protein
VAGPAATVAEASEVEATAARKAPEATAPVSASAAVPANAGETSATA